MTHSLGPGLLAFAILAGVWGSVAVGQGRSPVQMVDRATDAAARAQDRLAAAQQRAARATQSLDRVQDRTASVQDRASQAADSVARAANRQVDTRGRPLPETSRLARQLADGRQRRLEQQVLTSADRLEMTIEGPVVKGQILAIDPDATAMRRIIELGYRVVSDEAVEGLQLRSVVLTAPPEVPVERAIAQLRRAAPNVEFAANHLHAQSASTPLALLASATLASGSVTGSAIGIIDGGVAAHPALSAPVEQRGFAAGAPTASAHATAVASLIAARSQVVASAPGTPLLVADVFGHDATGGASLSITKAIGWLVSRRAPVIVVSLVGPANPLVRRAVEQARAAGSYIVAPVGNDGPASPPAYPASYPGVIAVTGVDARNRALIEAGRSLHLDYAAPAAGLYAADLSGGTANVRGTSFAAPLVAGRLFQAQRAPGSPIERLDREAFDLGAKGPDRVFGRGLLCARCRTPSPKNRSMD